jgi:hypothetical protein
MNDSDRKENERVLRAAKLGGEDSLNALDRWRLRDARAQEERVNKRRAEDRERERAWMREQEQKHSEVAALRTELQQAIADVRSEIDQRQEFMMEVVGTALGEFGGKVADNYEKLVRDTHTELLKLVERRFAETQAHIEAILPDVRSRESKSFRFASERTDDDVIDLPDWRKMN